MLALLVLVIFVMLLAAPCVKLFGTGPNPDDLEYIGDNRYRHKKTGEIYRWDQDIGAS